MLTEADVAQFKRDGFFIAREVFNAEELEHYRKLARNIQEKTRQHLYPGTRYWFGDKEERTRAKDTDYPHELRAQASWGINELPRKELFEPDLVNVFGQDNIHQAMHALLDQPRAWGIKMLWSPTYKPYDLGWHRDQLKHDLYDYIHYKPVAQDHVQFNAALNEDHCFLVIPGSHRRTLTEEEWQKVRTNEPITGEVVAECKAGDVLFMDAHALHRGRCSTDSDRLTLHYSAQSQWVPLKPWGHEGHFDWLTSDAFIGQLSEKTRPYYERLKTAERTEDAMGFVKQEAVEHGWVAQAV